MPDDGSCCVVASNPKGNERTRRKIAAKILANDLLSEYEWKWLARHSTYHLDTYTWAPLTSEDAAAGREAKRRLAVERKQIEADAYRKAYGDVLQRLLAKDGILKEGLLDRAIEELAMEEPDVGLIRLGVKVGDTVADRNIGKVAQKFEGKMEHRVSQLDALHAAGELDFIEAEVVDTLELEAGGG